MLGLSIAIILHFFIIMMTIFFLKKIAFDCLFHEVKKIQVKKKLVTTSTEEIMQETLHLQNAYNISEASFLKQWMHDIKMHGNCVTKEEKIDVIHHRNSNEMAKTENNLHDNVKIHTYALIKRIHDDTK